MFRGLTDFGRQRTVVEAIGFYLAYLVMGMLLSAALGFLVGTFNSGFGFDEGLQLGMVVGSIISALLAFAILWAKGSLWHIGMLVIGLLSVAGTLAGGLLLGLVFVAFLTTRPAILSSEPVEAGLTF